LDIDEVRGDDRIGSERCWWGGAVDVEAESVVEEVTGG
jgi:hypothetical protein